MVSSWALGKDLLQSSSLGLARDSERLLVWQVVALPEEGVSWQQRGRGYVTLARLRYLATGSDTAIDYSRSGRLEWEVRLGSGDDPWLITRII